MTYALGRGRANKISIGAECTSGRARAGHLPHASRIALVGYALAHAGCGSAVAEAIRPRASTYAEAAGATACADGYGQPLVVDWRPEQRADLEVQMREGAVVLAYDCKS